MVGISCQCLVLVSVDLQKIQKRQDLTEETKNKLLYQNAKALYAI
jgi:hypothetical protein